jgi:hypothetical protein
VCDHLIEVTQRIALAPHRKPLTFLDANQAYRKAGVGGCVTGEEANGEVRAETSFDHGTMYLGFLVGIPGVSMVKAKAVRQRFPTLRNLFDAYAACTDARERDRLLADLSYTSNGRRLGPAVSALVAKVFTSVDGELLIHTGAAPGAEHELDYAETPLGSQQ